MCLEKKFGVELVSVVVYAYNSGETIIDTLDSIKNQTYKKLELIVSDDASTDDTMDKTRNWIKENSDRFVRCIAVPHFENIGISKHFISAFSYTNGNWIKTVAADDTLIDNCVWDDVKYVKRHKDTEFLITSMYLFDEARKKELSSGTRAYCRFLCYQDAKMQYRLLLHRDVTVSPSEFFCADILKKYGEPDNPTRDIEDWPLRLHLTKSGCRMSYMDKPTVNYRQNTSSISRLKGCFFNPNHIKNILKIEQELVYPNIKKYDLIFLWNKTIKFFRYNMIIKLGNRPTILIRIINKFLLLFQPSTYVKVMWEIIGRIYDRRNACR